MARRQRVPAFAERHALTTPKESESYRGYLIRVNNLNGTMWIEKDGVAVGNVPPSESWAYARKAIDMLVGEPARNPRRRRNPPLVAFANPGKRSVIGLLSGRVYEIAYRHLEDGKDYKHPFRPGVCLQLLGDGSIRIYHEDGKPLWGDF